jgi:hypothetical protein
LSDSGDRGACSDGRDIRMAKLALSRWIRRTGVFLLPANRIIVIDGATHAVLFLDLYEQQSSCCDQEEQW